MKNIKKIGYVGTLSLVVGNIIGVGIFTTTGYAAKFINSPLIIMAAWLLGSIYALSGAHVYGILAKKHPYSGGDYQYLKHEIHPLLGYIFGWSALMVTYTGSIAALSIGAAHYLSAIFNLEIINDFIINFELIKITTEKIIAILLISIFSWINIKGIKISSLYQILFTMLIVLFLLIFSVAGLMSQKLHFNLLVNSSVSFQISTFFTGLVAVIFTYIGWTSAVYIAEEITDPKKILSTVLVLGVGIVTILYLMINTVYLTSLPIEEISDVINIASVVVRTLWGEQTAIIISGFIFIAILSTLNSTILSGPRIYMAMSRNGYLWGKFEKLHQKYKTPSRAIIVQFAWAVVLVLTGSFNQLLSYVVFVTLIFSSFAGYMSISILLKQKIENYFKILICVFYTLLCIIISLNILANQFIESLFGLTILVLAIIFYFVETKIKEKNE